MPNSFARIEGAEFCRMGQAGHKARYPIHWHLLDRITGQNQAGRGQYANNKSIHESFSMRDLSKLKNQGVISFLEVLKVIQIIS